MPGFGPSYPLKFSRSAGGYSLIHDVVKEIEQNLKNLFLTVPSPMGSGKVGDADFGIGLKTFLFEQGVQSVGDEITSRVYSQIGKYMPFVEIEDLLLEIVGDENLLNIELVYKVPSLLEEADSRLTEEEVLPLGRADKTKTQILKDQVLSFELSLRI